MAYSSDAKFLPPKEVALEYGGSIRYWRREIWAGNLPAAKLGARVYVSRAALEIYMREHAMVSQCEVLRIKPRSLDARNA